MNTRTLRTAAALAAVAALTLTACESGGEGGKKDKAAASDAPASATPAAGGDTDSGDKNGDKDGDEAPGDEAGDDAKSPGTSGLCDGALKIEVRPVKSPVNHVLLVATNTSDKLCLVDGFPFLRFDQDQATANVVEESRTQDRIMVRPGKSAYAGITASSASGSGGKGRDVKQLTVTFQDLKGRPLAGTKAQPALPGGTLHVDDSARTTYWVDAEAIALEW
ncbi:DUF4232 domain-containing protein [Streptomyces sp. NPDC026206]|uniref:DUF4232 domain-containing protein n=1 Tax=Streptomyces sp. NPDC026206 TaxID=3157089 RepID=UPI0033CE266B